MRLARKVNVSDVYLPTRTQAASGGSKSRLYSPTRTTDGRGAS
jgi:hypothetical protein